MLVAFPGTPTPSRTSTLVIRAYEQPWNQMPVLRSLGNDRETGGMLYEALDPVLQGKT